MIDNTLDSWHELVKSRNPAGLGDLLHEDVVFHSPVVHSPQRGKQITQMYLTAAFHVLMSEKFSYVREVVGEREAILEFSTVIDGITVNGVDIISWGEDGRITEFKVMVRPLKAVNLIHQMMAAMLKKSV
jgi:SnoaL-like domain